MADFRLEPWSSLSKARTRTPSHQGLCSGPGTLLSHLMAGQLIRLSRLWSSNYSYRLSPMTPPVSTPLVRADIILYFCGTQAYPAFYTIHSHSCSLLYVSWVIMCFLRTELRTSLIFEPPGPKCLLIHSFNVWSVLSNILIVKGQGHALHLP